MNRIVFYTQIGLILTLGPSHSASQSENGGIIRKSRSDTSSITNFYFPDSSSFLQPASTALTVTLKCDNDTAFGVGVNDSIGWMEAMQLTASDSCSLFALLFWPADPDTEFPDLHWRVWGDSSGLPGSLLDSGTVSPSYNVWYQIDLPDTEKIYLSSGEFIYIGWASVDTGPFYWNAFDDTSGTMDCTYWFNGTQWLFDPFFGGDFLVRGLCETTDSLIGVEENSPTAEKSRTTILLQNQPNPFHHSTVIRYQIHSTNHVTLKVYDLTGRHVETLVDETLEPGFYEVQWDGRSPKTGVPFSSGIYFYRLESPQIILTKKLTLLR